MLIPDAQQLRIPGQQGNGPCQSDPEKFVSYHAGVALNDCIQRHDQKRKEKSMHLLEHGAERHTQERHQIPP